VTRLSAGELRKELEWADTVDIRAHNGYRTDELLTTVRDGVDASPDIGVFMPGYNDILQDRAETTALETMVELASEIPCSVWLLIPTDGGYSTEQVNTWNRRVLAAAEDHDSIHIERDWTRLVERSPEFTFLSEADAVHPNLQGQTAIAKVMSRAATRECR
jgi:hypothetical protein